MDYKQNLNSIEYANGDKLFYTYDDNTGNVLSILSNDASSTNPNATKLLYEYNYDPYGELVKITDYDSKRIIEYTETDHTIKEFTVSDTQELIIGRTISTFTINESGNKEVTLFGNEFITQTSEAIYNESSKETNYATQCHFNIAEGPVTFGSQSVSDYFGRIKYSQISVAMDNAPESTHNIKNSYTYKNYSASINDETVVSTTNLIQSCTSEVFTAQSGNVQDTLVSLTTSYWYDNSGRITHIFYNQGSGETFATYYRYDAAGQLILEFDDLKGVLTEYEYDSHGNLTSKIIYQKDQIVVNYDEETYTVKENEEPQTITYNYGNTSNSGLVYSDVLTSVLDTNVSDEPINISYDNNGNPLNLFINADNNISHYTLEWDGTLLNSITNTESGFKCDYSYDSNGIRTKKTLYEIDENGTINPNKVREINYIWDDGLLIGSEITTYEIVIDSNDGTTSNVVTNTVFTKTLYDEYDNPIGVYYKSDLPEGNGDDSTINVLPSESIFWFIKDGQGNVKAMITDSTDYALGCSYDAYGNITLNLAADFLDEINSQISASTSTLEQVLLATVASIVSAISIESTLSIGASTYRGYIFDTESGLLYCQNRYYSPTIGRFINMDDPAQLTANMEDSLNSNLYAYCGNDPINNIDPTGRSKYTLSAVGMQAEMSASLLSFAGAVGIELVYVWSKNAVYAYYYYGGGAGVGYTNSAINYLKNSLKSISMSPKVSLKNISHMFRLNWSIAIGFFAAFTDKKFSWPNSYVGNSKSTAISIGPAKGYKATGTGCNVYGICYSVAGNSGFSVSTVNAKYKRIQFSNSAIKTYLSSQKNAIKKAVE